jgi:hypothetical protein
LARLKTVRQAIVAQNISNDLDTNTPGVADSILRALAYSDLFDYPLTLAELTRYQIETAYSEQEVERALIYDSNLRTAISRSNDGLYCLRNREETFDIRKSREAASNRLWKRARLYGAIMSRFPFVRMITVTGALAVNNIAAHPDIDLLVVTKHGRVWIARRLIVILVRLARIFRDDLCPNYIISERTLGLDQRDLFTAHELAQMVPLSGASLYRRMLAQNSWAEDYLPAAFSSPRTKIPARKPGPVGRLAEKIFGWSVLNRWERWELGRLRHKLRPLVGKEAEVVCSPTQCKGHTGLHRQWVTTRYEERLNELKLS